MNPKYKILFPLCLVLFIDAIGASVVFPILPELFLNTHYGLIKDMGVHSRNLLFGLTMGVFPLVTLFGMPVFGVFSDRYGRKNLIFIGLLGVVLSYALSIVALFSHSLIVFVIGRIVGGLLRRYLRRGDGDDCGFGWVRDRQNGELSLAGLSGGSWVYYRTVDWWDLSYFRRPVFPRHSVCNRDAINVA
jgi:MFS family permease